MMPLPLEDPMPGTDAVGVPQQLEQRELSRTSPDAPAGELAAASGSEEDHERERLEGLLAERARDLAAERAETARLRALLRDALAQLSNGAPQGAQSTEALERERDQAVQRAVQAELGRAEVACRLDEVLGHLLAAGAGEGALPGERLDVTCARLSGTVRGMVSALAEAEEGRHMAEARVLLLEQDLGDARTRLRSLERELSESREHAELEAIRSAGLETRLSAVQSARDQQASRVAELDRSLARESENAKELRAELTRERAQTLVVGEELARAREQVVAAQASTATLLEAREVLQNLAASVNAVMRVESGASLEHDDDAGWESSETTEPGLPSALSEPDEPR